MPFEKACFARQNIFCKATQAWKIFLARPICLGRFLDVHKVGYFHFIKIFLIPCFKLVKMTGVIFTCLFERGIIPYADLCDSY